MCPIDPRSSVVSGLRPLIGPSMANRSKERDQTKHSAKYPLRRMTLMVLRFPCPDLGHQGSLLKPGLGVRWRLSGGRNLCPRGPAGHSLTRQRESPFPWAHQQQEGPKGSGAPCVTWQPKGRDHDGPISGCRS